MANDEKYVPPSRQGKVLIGGHFDPDVKRQLKMIAAAQDTTIQALLESAVQNIIIMHNGAAGSDAVTFFTENTGFGFTDKPNDST